MKKLKLYLDTTIFNFFFADEAPRERDITRKFFKEIDQYEVYFSDIVIKEIARCHPPKKEKLLKLMEKYSLEELMLDEEARILAHKYVYGIRTHRHLLAIGGGRPCLESPSR